MLRDFTLDLQNLTFGPLRHLCQCVAIRNVTNDVTEHYVVAEFDLIYTIFE